MEVKKLLKALDDTGATIINPVGSLHWLDLYRRYLTDELWALEKANDVLERMERISNLSKLPDKEEIRIASDNLVRMLEMRHHIEVGKMGERDYSKIIEQTECDFFGGIHLSSVVCILDTLYTLLNSDQDQQG